jgi:hypothetical protein
MSHSLPCLKISTPIHAFSSHATFRNPTEALNTTNKAEQTLVYLVALFHVQSNNSDSNPLLT